ncbi:hypothetical protein LOTGIDRAFT_159966 [Lottia gigantea]|uniref:Uncharacterized protein n=1 Tax=Lottia gigantea TaxID=225164 RepID=V4C4R1_LOTGI|nr:hypothetical protein LOTGIDRAFT_159966 [Lottia gigantea]ESO96549.1 hypothetical protein LOTGIDRAFT_159966 [Lottia gigantea]
MSITKKESPPNSTTRPACMPSKKDDGFLPPINLRATPSSDSDTDYRRDQNGRMLLSNENSSLTPSPVKLPSIGRSISTSVSSLTSNRRKEKDRRELCRSPSCPSNIGGIIDDLENGPDETDSSRCSKDDSDVKLPDIFKDNSKASYASYATPRTERKNGNKKKPEREDQLLKSRDASPEKHIAEKIAMGMKCSQSDSPRGDNLDTNRSTQCALLLPLRRNSMRKSKRKRKNCAQRQNTQISVKSESAASDGNSASDIIIPSSKSEYDYDPMRHDVPQNLSESDIDLNSDKSSEGNPVHPTYHVTKQMSNKHQIRMKDMANVKV